MMISTYMRDLLFSQDEFGRYIGSPYDVFLRMNHLPVQPLQERRRRTTTSVSTESWH